MKESRIYKSWLVSDNPSDLTAEIERLLSFDGITRTHRLSARSFEDYISFRQDEFYRCANDMCDVCDGSVVIHHILGKKTDDMFWNPLNRIPLCHDHHVDSSVFSAHRTPAKFKEWLEYKYPGRLAWLNEKYKIVHKPLEQVSVPDITLMEVL